MKWYAPIHYVDNYEPGDDADIWGYIKHFTFTESTRKHLARYSNANTYREICAIGKEALWVSFKGYLLLLEVSFIFKLRCYETLDRSQLLVSQLGRFNPGTRRIVGWFSRSYRVWICWWCAAERIPVCRCQTCLMRNCVLRRQHSAHEVMAVRCSCSALGSEYSFVTGLVTPKGPLISWVTQPWNIVT